MMLTGKDPVWKPTGVWVTQGDNLHITAGGEIRFSSSTPFSDGFPRDPDGRDRQGKIEIAPNGFPAPGLKRNSLIIRIGTSVMQGGTNVKLKAAQSGEIYISCNDDNTIDNNGFWLIEAKINEMPVPGILMQDFLFLFYGPNTVAQQNVIYNKIYSYMNYVRTFSNGKVYINYSGAVLPASYIAPYYTKEWFPDFGNAGLIQSLKTVLAPQYINPERFHAVILFFDEKMNSHTASKYAGLTWAQNRGTSICFTGTPDNIKGLDELILHEYLHHLDFYYEKRGEGGFINPDCLTGVSGNVYCRRAYNVHSYFYKVNPPATNIEFYEGIMKWLDRSPAYGADDFQPVNYRQLDGLFGYWK